MTKKYGDHSIADILRLKPKWFMERQTTLTTTAGYLSQLHQMLDFGFGHLAPHPFIEVFGLYDVSTLPPQEFNRLMATFVPKPPQATPEGQFCPSTTRFELIPFTTLRESLTRDTSSIQNALDMAKTTQANETSRIGELQDNIDELHRQIREKSVMLGTYDDMIHGYEKSLEQPSSIDRERLTLLRAIPDQWIVVHTTQQQFTIVRRTPITLRYTNASSGMCKTLYLGFMGLVFNWDMSCSTSFHMADYIGYTSGRVHPHVNGGYICWGNTSHRASKHIESRNYSGYFELLETLLTTYCPDNPFVAFHTLERAKNEKYVAINELTSNWYRDNRQTLIRIWSRSASDKFREVMATKPASQPSKADGFAYWVNNLLHKFTKEYPDRVAKINNQLAATPMRGHSLRNFLQSYGFRIPNRDAALITGARATALSQQMLGLMILCYDRVEFAGDKYAVMAPGDRVMYCKGFGRYGYLTDPDSGEMPTTSYIDTIVTSTPSDIDFDSYWEVYEPNARVKPLDAAIGRIGNPPTIASVAEERLAADAIPF